MSYVDASSQTTKIMHPQLLLNEFPQVPTNRSKIQFDTAKEIKKIPSEKNDHQSLLELKKQIQDLIDFKSHRIVLLEIPTNAFSKNLRICENFQLITLDGEPVPKVLLCKKCKQVRARCRLTSTPIVRHVKQHEEAERAHKMEEKKNTKIASQYAKYLNHAMKNWLPLPLIAKQCGEKLSPEMKDTIEKTVLSQGDRESQIRLRKKLKPQMGQQLRKHPEIDSVSKYLKNESMAISDKPFISLGPFNEMEAEESNSSTDRHLAIQVETNNCSSVNVPFDMKVDGAEMELVSIEPRFNAESSLQSS